MSISHPSLPLHDKATEMGFWPTGNASSAYEKQRAAGTIGMLNKLERCTYQESDNWGYTHAENPPMRHHFVPIHPPIMSSVTRSSQIK